MSGVSVGEFGARGDGKADDSGAFQSALDSGRGSVSVPAGEYRIGRPIRMGSRTRLKLHPEAKMFLGDGAAKGQRDFLLCNRDPEAGNEDIEIEGGIWDGNCRGNPRGPDKPGNYTGVMMDFCNVKNLSLRNMTLLDAESYFVRMGEVRDFTVESLVFRAPHPRPNQDGIHLGGFCEDGVIRNLKGVGPFATNDDLVALNADDILWRVQNIGMKCGAILRIRVTGLEAEDCHTFIRLLSVDSAIEDVTIEGVRGGCRVCALNMDAARKCKTPMFDPADTRVANGVGLIKNVTLKDFDVYKCAPGYDNPMLDIMTRVENFSIINFRRDPAKDRNPENPSLSIESVPYHEVILEGLNDGQVRAMHGSSHSLSVDITPTGGASRASTRTGKASLLVLPGGGFASMRVSRFIGAA